MKNLQLIETTPEELNELIQNGVKNQLESLKKDLKNQSNIDEVLTRNEVCELLKINPSTLWQWTKKGKVKSYNIANRVYYKRSEIELSLKELNRNNHIQS